MIFEGHAKQISLYSKKILMENKIIQTLIVQRYFSG